jgi:hypothetical protein
MNTGAWYHLSTLEQAKDEYFHMLLQAREDALELFAKDPPKRWSWRHLRNIPMTMKEYWAKYWNPYYSRFYYAYPDVVENTVERLEEMIGLARRAEQNLVFLVKDDIRRFGSCLTKPYEPGELFHGQN